MSGPLGDIRANLLTQDERNPFSWCNLRPQSGLLKSLFCQLDFSSPSGPPLTPCTQSRFSAAVSLHRNASCEQRNMPLYTSLLWLEDLYQLTSQVSFPLLCGSRWVARFCRRELGPFLGTQGPAPQAPDLRLTPQVGGGFSLPDPPGSALCFSVANLSPASSFRSSVFSAGVEAVISNKAQRAGRRAPGTILCFLSLLVSYIILSCRLTEF